MSTLNTMEGLCQQFPSLWGEPGIAPWDAELFARAAGQFREPAPRQAAAFVLAVHHGCQPDDGGWWKPYGVPRFDAVFALHYWDAEHRAAFANWCEAPWWP